MKNFYEKLNSDFFLWIVYFLYLELIFLLGFY